MPLRYKNGVNTENCLQAVNSIGNKYELIIIKFINFKRKIFNDRTKCFVRNIQGHNRTTVGTSVFIMNIIKLANKNK